MTKIYANQEMSEKEKNAYVSYLEKKYRRKIAELAITVDEAGEFVDLDYTFEPMPFERIRRITGYLTGTLDTWNDAKAAEEKDRVKHDLSGEMEKI